MEEARARIKDGDVWGETFVFVGPGHGSVLLVQLRDAAGTAIREYVNEKRWWRRRRRRYRCLEGGANHRGSGLHGGADLRWAENTTHGALEQQDLSSRIQGLVFDNVLGDVDIFGVSPTGDDNNSRLVVCTGAAAAA